MAGKLNEIVKTTQAFKPASRTTATTQYNGSAAGSGIDTQDYDEAKVILNVGTAGAAASATFSITEHDSDAPLSSSAVSNASFTKIDDSADDLVRVGYLNLSKRKRYLWVKMVQGNTTAVNAGAVVELGQKDSNPVTQDNEDFEV